MHINFTPKRKNNKEKVLPYPLLIVENDVIEYSFLKSNTIVSVYAHIDDISSWNYDKNDHIIIINGKFSVASRNIITGNESLNDFRKENRVFSFIYDFRDLDKFLQLIKSKKDITLSKNVNALNI